MWAAAAAVAFSSFAARTIKIIFSPRNCWPNQQAAPSIFFITFWAFSYILFVRVCMWVRVIKNSSPTCMMNKAASERRRKRISLMTLLQRKREEEECLGAALGAGCCAAQISAKLQNQSLFARREPKRRSTSLLLGKLDFVINWCPRHKVRWIINQLLLSPPVKIHIWFF